MSWNYRLIEHKDGEDVFLQIHEVYYNKEGKPISCTERGVSICGENLQEVELVLDMMKEALKKPIIKYENI